MVPNGHFNGYLEKVASDVSEIKQELSEAVVGLTAAINNLSSKVEMIDHSFKSAVPIKLVYYICSIIAMAFLGSASLKALTLLAPLP